MYITCLFSATTKCIMDESPKSSGPPPIDFVTGRLGDDTPKHQAYAFCAQTTAQTSKLPMQKYMYRTSKWFNRITGYKSPQLHIFAGLTNPLEDHSPSGLPIAHIPRSHPPRKPPPCLSRISRRQMPLWLPLLLPDLPPGSPITRKWCAHAHIHAFSRKDHKKFKSCTPLGSGSSAVATAHESLANTAPLALTHDHCYYYCSLSALCSLYSLCYSLLLSLLLFPLLLSLLSLFSLPLSLLLPSLLLLLLPLLSLLRNLLLLYILLPLHPLLSLPPLLSLQSSSALSAAAAPSATLPAALSAAALASPQWNSLN